MTTRRKILAGLAAVPVVGALAAAFGPDANPYYQGPVSDHFDGVRFFDRHGSAPKPFSDLLRWQFGSDPKATWPDQWPLEPADPVLARVDRGIAVTLVGHASLLLQVQGLNILIDPLYSERASPVSFAGPKRVNPPGVPFEALPKIDLVLVSHGHYDHLDLPTLSRLAAVHAPRVITPLGNDAIMRAHDGAIRAEAFDWGDDVDLGGGVRLHLSPMRHWSARGLTDRNKALWAAFTLETAAGLVHHVGDSGYGDGHHFKRARERFGPIRLAILPIGAYEPRWFMADQHMNPEEAVKAFLDLGARTAFAHHWGTVQLTNEAIEAPRAALAAALVSAGLPADRFLAPRPGRRAMLDADAT